MLGIVSNALSGLNAHWTAETMAEEFARLREAAGEG
jgi:TDG/mug DNA glycosylase family protein